MYKNLPNQNYSSYEIIVVDTSTRPSKDKYKNVKKLKYFHIKEKFKKFPVLNQMYQIQYGFLNLKEDIFVSWMETINSLI